MATRSRKLPGIALALCALLSILTPLHAAEPAPGVLTSTRLDADVSEFRLEDLKASLKTMQPGPERDYFAGILDNRTGRIEESIGLLNSAIPSIRKSQPTRAALALQALADDYNKSFRYGEAASTYDELLAHFSGELEKERLQGTRDDAGLLHLLAGAPAQTIAWQGPTRLRTERNAIGSIVTELTVNGVQEKWLLDTGANMSVVTKSFAQRLGLKALPGFAQTGAGVTGIENPLQVALVPTLQIGGATLRNVVVMIFDDANLKINMGKQSYQINAIIGYPVFQALGSVTFVGDTEFYAGDAAQSSAAGTRMYMKLLTPVIECGVDGKELPFSFDTGASSTELSYRYYEKFRAHAGSWKKGESKSGGAGGTVNSKIYMQPRLNLEVGDKAVVLRQVAIFPMKMGSGIDELYGNVGQDLVAGFQSFTLDFSKMTFSLGAPQTAKTMQ